MIILHIHVILTEIKLFKSKFKKNKKRPWGRILQGQEIGPAVRLHEKSPHPSPESRGFAVKALKLQNLPESSLTESHDRE